MKYEENHPVFCANIRRLREVHGLSKKEMARILGVGVGMITALERGELPRRLGSTALIRASDHFGFRTDDLFLPLGE